MKPLQILLAEDNRADILLVREALNEHGVIHELHVVRDGEEAIQFLVQMGQDDGPPCPDLMLLDMNLPKAEGSQVLLAFRRHPECAHTPVIVVSSSDSPRDKALMQQLGVSHYFKKSSDFDEYMKLGAIDSTTCLTTAPSFMYSSKSDDFLK